MSLARGAVLMVVATAVQQAIDVVTVMILTRTVSQHDYGTYGQCSLVIQTLLPLLVLGLPTTISSLLPRLDGGGRQAVFLRRTTLRLALFGVLGGGSLAVSAGAIAEMFDNPDLHGVVQLAGLTLACEVAAAYHPHFYTVSGRLGRYALLCISYSAIRVVLICVIAACVPPADMVHWVVAAMAVCSAVRLAIVTCDAWTWQSGQPAEPHPEDARHQWNSALPLGIAQAIGTVNRMADKNIVASLTTPTQYAVYSAGAFEVPLIGSITGAINAVLLPRMSQDFGPDVDNANVLRRWRLSVIASGFVIIPIFFALLAFPFGVISILFSDAYLSATPIFMVFLALIPVRAIDLMSPLIAADHNGLITRGLLAAVVIEAAALVSLVLLFGPYGAAGAFVLATYGYCVISLIWIGRVYRTDLSYLLPLRAIFRIALISGSIAVFVYLILMQFHLSHRVNLFIGAPSICVLAWSIMARNDPDIVRIVTAVTVRRP